MDSLATASSTDALFDTLHGHFTQRSVETTIKINF